MKHKNSTKRTLALSLLVMLLCVAMLVGTTFAWFTDSATSSGNKIQAGTLNINLLVKNARGQYESVKDSQAAIFDYDKWEPGYTEVKNVMVKTTGNLALKYTLSIVPKSATADALKLAEVIDVYYASSEVIVTDRTLTGLTKIGTLKDVLNGAEGTIINDTLIPDQQNTADFATIALKMQESAGNDYQGLSVGEGFDLNLVATQYTYEEDSFDDQYDKNAQYPVAVSSQTAFAETVAASENSNIVLSAGTYTLPAAANKTVAISGTKDTVIDLTSATGQSLSGTDLSFENVTVKGTNSDYVGIQHSGDIVYNNVTFNDSTTLYGESVTFNNCTFNLSTRYIWTYGAKEVTFNNCTFNTDGKAILIYAESGVDSQTVNVNGCTFNATRTGYTGSGDPCAAVEIDASLISGRYTVNFTGTNTVDSDFNGIYRIKNNSASKVTINGIN